jgi:hypothetical protein
LPRLAKEFMAEVAPRVMRAVLMAAIVFVLENWSGEATKNALLNPNC